MTLALVLCTLSFQVLAINKVDPGELPRLSPDDGFLVLSVDSDVSLYSMSFRKDDGLFVGGSLRMINEGRTTQLYRLPAGHYHWTKITVFQNWSGYGGFDLGKREEFAFEVKPGQINYAGDMVYRQAGFLRAGFRLSNRTLPVLDWLHARHPQLATRFPFAYNGFYPDPFPAFYLEAKAQAVNSPADPDSGREAPQPGELPLSPRLLWQAERINDVALSDDGQLVVEAVRDTPSRWGLDLYDLKTGAGQRLTTSDMSFEDIRWESDRILLATTRNSGGTSWLHAFHVGEPVDGKRAVRRVDGPVAGKLVDLLPNEPGTVLYQRRDGNDQIAVHRLRLDGKEDVQRFTAAKSRDRLNVGVENDLGWFADGQGELRAAFARVGEDEIALLHGRQGAFREVLRYQSVSGFQPLQLSYDGELFYGFTDEDRGQRELVEFDPALGKVRRTLYSKPGVDLVSATFDTHRNPIGASYYQDGRLVTDYFDEAGRHLDTLLRQAFPGRTVAVMQRSRDAGQMLLWVDGSDQPAQLYLLDVVQRRAELFDSSAPHLAEYKFVPAQVLKVHGSDGLPVEAFLTMPSVEGKRPLVVMPHGGPIGISDDLHFNRDVQFLASLGYAVLQVNFRGSDGYGKAFREAGYRNYGKLIEEDIDAAIKTALAAYPLDESRMCTLGTSYGGYSAMVSTIRWSKRFRCAVSISGVSDRALFFTASDSGRDAQTRKYMERIMGNPGVASDLAEMQSSSPLYRYRDLQVPLMLVHGGEDARVDFEHTRRLVRLLNYAGRPPVLLTFPKEGHGLEMLDSLDQAWTAIAGFLGQYLGNPQAIAPARTPAGDQAASSKQAKPGEGGQGRSAP